MALVACPECGTEVSSSAAACPHCAFPLRSPRDVAPLDHGARPPAPVVSGAAALDVTRQITGRLALVAVLFPSGVIWEAPPVILASLAVLGSCIPIWRKAKRGLVGGAETHVQAQVDSRLAEVQEHLGRKLSDIEQRQIDRLADLEERIDFTERLLVKRREEHLP
jgi:hypothetical protein